MHSPAFLLETRFSVLLTIKIAIFLAMAITALVVVEARQRENVAYLTRAIVTGRRLVTCH